MAQRYKLRLGDGSIRLVDADELRTWLGDGNAMVQTPGSYRWSPLREFVTEEPALLDVPPKPGEGEMSPDPVVPPSDRVARPPRGEPTAVQALADDLVAAPAADVGGKPTDADRFPTIRLKPPDDRGQDHEVEAVPHPLWRERLAQVLLPVVAAFGTLLSRSLDRLRARQNRPRPPVPSWLWTKRSAVIAGLVAGGIFGVLTWKTWLPKLARLGQVMFTETDRPVPSQHETEEQQRALLAATQQLPQLAPETIHLLMSSGPGGVLDPARVFQLAGDAADRGRSALTTGEAKELKTLQRELVRSLRPRERQRVREYDRARSRGVVFASENRRVLELSARGARALPPRTRERLQVLLGKAISAGLVRPWDAPTR